MAFNVSRPFALAGAAIAALSLAACSKPAATNDTNTAAATDTNAATPDNAMSNMTTDTTTTNNMAS